MNIIAIDPSLSCTAVVVNDKKFCFVKEDVATTGSGTLKKWFKNCESLIEIHIINYEKIHGFSEQEIIKIQDYDRVTNLIIDKIKPNNTEQTKVFMEGYSYSSQTGPLIDLVTFSTLLRLKLIHLGYDVTIIAPKTLKSKTAAFTYEGKKVGKKVEHRNHDGISGGQFKKPEMYKALIENDNLNCEWVEFLRSNKEEILKSKNIPKPIEDINDAKLLYEIHKSNK